MLTLGEEKMSKSVGNVQTIHALAEAHDGEVLRYALLSGQYRSQLAWSGDLLAQAKASLDTLYQALRDKPGMGPNAGTPHPPSVVEALCDDLNTPLALAAMHELAARLQKANDQDTIDAARAELLAAGELMGLLHQDVETYFRGGDGDLDDATIDALIQRRNDARADKDFAEADRIRDELVGLGVELEDTREGTRWRRI